MAKVIGIDLGTTNSCVAVIEGEDPVVILNGEGYRTTPSIIAFSKKGEKMLGEDAKREALFNPDRTISSIRRDMGSERIVEIDDIQYTPQQISAMILQKLKVDAQVFLGETIRHAVIAVPTDFSDSQIQATKDAGKIAGLEVLSIINEPTAAAMAYGLDKENGEQKVLVFDMGGRSLDISILEIDSGVIEILATNRNNKLGGDDFDQKLIDFLVAEFRKENEIDLSKDVDAIRRLKGVAEKAKIELSTLANSRISQPCITRDQYWFKGIDITLTREKFDELTADLVEMTMESIRLAMKNFGLTPENIDKIILVGGSTKIPAVQEAVKKYFRKELFYKGINPEECVAIGAAIYAAVLTDESFDRGGCHPRLELNSISLGIETLGSICTPIIDSYTFLPTKKSQIFSTTTDGQTSVAIHVLQGEGVLANHNKTLGRFQLTGIEPAPRGIPQIEVAFDIAPNGIVHVSAKDLGTGNEQKITVTAVTNLSDDEIDEAVKEAEKLAQDDKKLIEEVVTRIEADSIIYNKTKIETAINKLEETIKGTDTEVLIEDIEVLKQLFYELPPKIYLTES